MTETSTPAPNTPFISYMQVWAASLAHVLGQISNSAFAVEAVADAPPDAVPSHETDFLAMVVSAGALRGEMSFRFPKPVALAMAQLFLSEPQNPAADFSAESRESVEELLRQVGGHASTALKPQWGETQIGLEFGTAPSWSAGASGWVNSAAEAPFRLWSEWQMSAALLAALKMAQAKAQVMANAQSQLQEQGPSENADAATEPTASPASAVTEGVSPPGKLNPFQDVDLAVTLRFGGRRMLLREILELNSGTVVELDRQVQEPADLLLDGKVIARGEIVVVDGNYGLRVLEVISPAAEPFLAKP